MMTKKEIRMQVKELFKTRRSDELIAASLGICDSICNRVAALGKPNSVILLYWSLPDEVQVSAVVEKLFRAGHTVLLPVVLGETMVLKKYCGHESLVVGPFGILQPVGDNFEDFDAIDLAFVPGRAFTTDGCRIGRGNGYYDRLLPSIKSPKVGICYQFQIVDEIPMDLFDVKLDDVIWG